MSVRLENPQYASDIQGEEQKSAQAIVDATFSLITPTAYNEIVALATDEKLSPLDKYIIIIRYIGQYPDLFETVPMKNGFKHQMRADVRDHIRAFFNRMG